MYDGSTEDKNVAKVSLLLQNIKTSEFVWIQQSLAVTVFSKWYASELNMTDFKFTGFFKIQNVIPDKHENGLTFGILYRDNDGNYHVYKSK